MYEMSRKLWVAAYFAAFAVLITLSVLDSPDWLWFSWAGIYLLFVVMVDPAPSATVSRVVAGCGCDRCEKMRARHARKGRRSTDPKNVG